MAGNRLRPVLPALSADFGTACRRFVSVEDTCKPYPRDVDVVAAVNILTGAVTDPRNQKSLDTAESLALAKGLLRRSVERRDAAATEIDSICK